MKKVKINKQDIVFEVVTHFGTDEHHELLGEDFVKIYPLKVRIVLSEGENESDDKIIGTLNGYFFSEAEATYCYEAMDNHSYELCDLADEFIEPFSVGFEEEDEDDDYLKQWVVDIDEHKDTNVLIINRVFIDEEYRGNGILKDLINVVAYSHNKCPIILKAFPLQYEGIEEQESGFRKASLKVRKAYMNCGFTPLKRGSEYMYLIQN